MYDLLAFLLKLLFPPLCSHLFLLKGEFQNAFSFIVNSINFSQAFLPNLFGKFPVNFICEIIKTTWSSLFKIFQKYLAEMISIEAGVLQSTTLQNDIIFFYDVTIVRKCNKPL